MLKQQLLTKGGNASAMKQYLDSHQQSQKWGMSPRGTPQNVTNQKYPHSSLVCETADNYPMSEQKHTSAKIDPAYLESNQRTLTLYNQNLITETDLRMTQGYHNMQTEYLRSMNSATLNARKLEPSREARGHQASMAQSANSQMNRKFADNGLDKSGGLHTSGDPDAGSMSHSATFNNYKQHVKSQYQYSSQQSTGQKAMAMTPQKE